MEWTRLLRRIIKCGSARKTYKDPTNKVHVARMETDLKRGKKFLFVENLEIEWRRFEEESGMDRSQIL